MATGLKARGQDDRVVAALDRDSSLHLGGVVEQRRRRQHLAGPYGGGPVRLVDEPVDLRQVVAGADAIRASEQGHDVRRFEVRTIGAVVETVDGELVEV